MCNAISFWYVGHGDSFRLIIDDETDSHSEIAEKHGIRDNDIGKVCAGEFHPNWSAPSADPATWVLEWDYLSQSRRPDWMDNEHEARLRSQLETAAKRYIHVSGHVEIKSCRAFVFGGTARGSSKMIYAFSSSRVEAWDSSRVEARGSSSVVARGSSRVEAWGSSRVEAWGSSRVVARSEYADVCGRADWDGKGYRPLRGEVAVGKTYGVRNGALSEIEATERNTRATEREASDDRGSNTNSDVD